MNEGVLADGRAHRLARDALLRRRQLGLHGVAQGDRLLGLQPLERLGQLLVAALRVRHARQGLPDLRVHARELHLGRAPLAGADLAALLGQLVEVVEAEPAALRRAEAGDGEGPRGRAPRSARDLCRG